MAKPQLIFLGLLLAMTMWSTSAQQVGIVTLTLPANIFEVKAPKVGDSLQFIVNWTVSTNLTFRVHDTVKNVSCSVLYRTLSARISCFAVSTRSHYLVVNTAFPEPIKYTVDVRVNTKLNNYYTNRLISSDPVYRAATTFPVGTQCLNATYNSSLGFFFLPTLSTRRYELFSPYTFTVGGQSFKMTQFSWRSFLHPTDQDPYISYDETGEYIVFALKGENDTTPEDPLTGIQQVRTFEFTCVAYNTFIQNECGDKVRSSEEQCDNGNVAGCTGCMVQLGYTCIGEIGSESFCYLSNLRTAL